MSIAEKVVSVVIQPAQDEIYVDITQDEASRVVLVLLASGFTITSENGKTWLPNNISDNESHGVLDHLFE